MRMGETQKAAYLKHTVVKEGNEIRHNIQKHPRKELVCLIEKTKIMIEGNYSSSTGKVHQPDDFRNRKRTTSWSGRKKNTPNSSAF